MNHMSTADILSFATGLLLALLLYVLEAHCVCSSQKALLNALHEIQVKSGGKPCKEAKADLEKKLKETSEKKEL
jgi:hypothetical protein